MNCGPLAEISEASIARITEQAGTALLKDYDTVPDDLGAVARLAVAATGGHVAVEDRFYFGCLKSVIVLKPKEQDKWKGKVDDGNGTRRRVYWDTSTSMLRVKDDRGVGVPLVPLSISIKVTRSDAGTLHHEAPEQQQVRTDHESSVSPTPPPVAPVKTVTGGGPYFYVGQGERGCKGGVYCDKDGKAKSGGGGGDDEYNLPPSRPPNEIEEYIRQILDNPARWTGNGLLMLFPDQYADLESTTFQRAFDKYEIEQPAASQRGAAHSTILRGKDRRKVGEIVSLERTQIDVYSVVAQGKFVDGDGPDVGIGYTLRFHLLNEAGEDLGTIFALGKRNIEANDPSKNDLDYYLFVDLTEEWAVSAPPVKVAPAPAAVNKLPAQWNQQLHDAMEFAAFRALGLLADQFTR